MPIKSYTVKEGLLRLGEVGSTIDATAQVTDVSVEWSEDVRDNRKTLSGDTLHGRATYTATLSGTVFQDLTVGGLVDFTWTNKGKVVPFTLSPSLDSEREITGQVRISPLTVGGEVEADDAESDFEWGCIGEPVLGQALV